MKLDELTDHLRRHDPAPADRFASAEERSEVIDRIVARPPSPERSARDRRRWPVALAVAATLAVATTALMVLPTLSSGGGAIATPPLRLDPASEPELDPADAAALARTAAAGPLAEGDRETIDWDLFTTVADGNSSSEVHVRRRRVTIAASGAVVTCRSGPIVAETLLAGEVEPSAVAPCGDPVEHSPGEYSLAQLPGDLTPAGLTAALASNDELADHHEIVTRFLDVARDRQLTPHENAAFLEAIAAYSSEFVDRGLNADRLGRSARVLTYQHRGGGLLTEDRLYFDPSSGQLLAEESVFLESGLLEIEPPSVVGYSLFL